MSAKRIALGVVCLGLCLAAGIALHEATTPQVENPPSIPDLMIALRAAETYAKDLTQKGQPVPSQVTAATLVELGYLSGEPAKKLADYQVTVATTYNNNQPQLSLVEATLQDGSTVMALNDGSVQVRRRR